MAMAGWFAFTALFFFVLGYVIGKMETGFVKHS
jgi:hypothetical protein